MHINIDDIAINGSPNEITLTQGNNVIAIPWEVVSIVRDAISLNARYSNLSITS